MADKFIPIAVKDTTAAAATATTKITKASIRVQRNQKLKLHTSRMRLLFCIEWLDSQCLLLDAYSMVRLFAFPSFRRIVQVFFLGRKLQAAGAKKNRIAQRTMHGQAIAILQRFTLNERQGKRKRSAWLPTANRWNCCYALLNSLQVIVVYIVFFSSFFRRAFCRVAESKKKNKRNVLFLKQETSIMRRRRSTTAIVAILMLQRNATHFWRTKKKI